MNWWLSLTGVKQKNRRIFDDDKVKEDLCQQLDRFQDKQSYNFETLYHDALIQRDRGFKATIVLREESGHTENIPNPDFSVREANDGYEGEWCGNPEFLGEKYVIDIPRQLVVVRGKHL